MLQTTADTHADDTPPCRRHCHRQIDRYSTAEKNMQALDDGTYAPTLHTFPLCHLFFVLRCVIFGGAEAWLSDATAERTEDRTKITINKRFVDSKAERIFRASRWQPVGCALVRVDKGKGSRWGLVVGVCWLAEQARSETKIRMRCGTMLGYMWCERRRETRATSSEAVRQLTAEPSGPLVCSRSGSHSSAKAHEV